MALQPEGRQVMTDALHYACTTIITVGHYTQAALEEKLNALAKKGFRVVAATSKIIILERPERPREAPGGRSKRTPKHEI
jgi:hypothetical protein